MEITIFLIKNYRHLLIKNSIIKFYIVYYIQMEDQIYKQKYLKYKKKYLDLKNTLEQEGGIAFSGFYFMFYSKEDLVAQVEILKETSTIGIFAKKLNTNSYKMNESVPSYDNIAKVLGLGFYLKNNTTSLNSIVLDSTFIKIMLKMIPKSQYSNMAKYMTILDRNNGKKTFTASDIEEKIKRIETSAKIVIDGKLKLKLNYSLFGKHYKDENEFKKAVDSQKENIKNIINMLRSKTKKSYDSCLIFEAKTTGNIYIDNIYFNNLNKIENELKHPTLNLSKAEEKQNGGSNTDYLKKNKTLGIFHADTTYINTSPEVFTGVFCLSNPIGWVLCGIVLILYIISQFQ